jgi:hypothetical protein
MICAVASPANNFMTGAVIMADGFLVSKILNADKTANFAGLYINNVSFCKEEHHG